jgi:hypothetical protein
VAALSSPNAGDESQSNSAEPPVEASPAAGAQRWVAENVALSAEEACVALEQEMHMAQSQPAAISDLATTAEEPIGQSTPIEDPKAELVEPDGATFAAAASAFASSVNAVSAIASETEVDAPSRSDATAAWQNWEQIRDSVMSPQQASEVAESIAQVAHAAAPPSLGDGEASDAAAIENAALAGIVDSVLAGLKPRLMEEIAKKLAADKKKT